MKNKVNFIKELLKDLDKNYKYLSEAYIFDGQEGAPEGPGMEEDPEMMGDPQMQGKAPQMAQNEPGEDPNGAMQNAEEQAMHAQEVIQHEPIIGKIRETAIEGLKKYSDHPTSSLYEFFKKVFLESDKVLTDTGSKK